MSLLKLSNINVELGGEPVLTNITLELPPSARWGVVGANGSGKTTLLNLIIGKVLPDGGDFYIPAKIKPVLMEQVPAYWQLSVGEFLNLARPELLQLGQELSILEDQIGEDHSLLDRYGNLQLHFANLVATIFPAKLNG